MSLNYRLSPESYLALRRILSIQTKPLGKILREADLISSFQLESALENQTYHPELRLGEILAREGLIKPATADFFVRDWSKVIIQPHKNALGYYLQQAAILDDDQIKVILAEQTATGVRFGTVAVFQGFIKSTTLDFFLTNLFPEEMHRSPFSNLYSVDRFTR